MILYGSFKSKMPVMIDFIEFEFDSIEDKFVPEDIRSEDNNRGVILSVDWDESEWTHIPEDGVGAFKAKGVYINQIYANGALDVFKTARADTIQVYCQGKEGYPEFKLIALEFVDGDERFEVPEEAFKNIHVEYV